MFFFIAVLMRASVLKCSPKSSGCFVLRMQSLNSFQTHVDGMLNTRQYFGGNFPCPFWHFFTVRDQVIDQKSVFSDNALHSRVLSFLKELRAERK